MNEIFDLLKAASTIAIFGHISPDGDCVGSCLGFYNFIKENYKPDKVTVYLEDFSKDFMFLSGSDQVCHDPDTDEVFDLGISLDCGDTFRHGDFGHIFKRAVKKISIDHHVSNEGFGDVSVVYPEKSSTCEILYDLFPLDKISKNTAECLYVGIVHDTGVFKHSCTAKSTMVAAGELLEKGVRSDYVIDKTFFNKTFASNKLLGVALLNAKLEFEGKLIYTILRLEDFSSVGATTLDTDGIVDQLRVTEGIEVALFIYQKAENEYKYSLRANSDVDVSKIAVAFGGGGHKKAAGVNIKEPVEVTLPKIFDAIRALL
ncbi:MAG: DHH family phosphoesterase [Lachnospiraceae bacterium]|nr:DHH family phosphoesterase [Lachnospiraceae bacterium]